MTTQDALNRIAFDEGFADWNDFLDYSEGQSANLTKFVQKAMRLYAQQFIDAANQIIDPATEILPDTYDEDYEKWYDIVSINKDEKQLKKSELK